MCATYKKISSPTISLKEKSMNLEIDKASDKLHLKIKKLTSKLDNNLTDLYLIFEKIEGINDNKRLEKKKIETHFKKRS